MSTDFGNFYENKFTVFEAGKTYHYGVYVTTIYGDRYVFGPDTKLKINGEFLNYERYEGDESDGSDGTMWVITDLAMIPQSGSESSNESESAVVTNKPADETKKSDDAPKTADDSNIVMWVVILIVTGALFVALLTVKKKYFKTK